MSESGEEVGRRQTALRLNMYCLTAVEVSCTGEMLGDTRDDSNLGAQPLVRQSQIPQA